MFYVLYQRAQVYGMTLPPILTAQFARTLTRAAVQKMLVAEGLYR